MNGSNLTVPESRLLSKTRPLRASNEPPVLMITPPSAFLLDERVFMSLGILKIAAVLPPFVLRTSAPSTAAAGA